MQSAEQLIRETIASENKDHAFYVCNMDDLLDKQRNWLAKMGPRIRPFYAVKCNISPVVIQTLAGLGLSFDCASPAEMEAILQTGTPASEIIYAHPCKSRSSLQFARSVGVDLMTFDSEEELLKIRDVFPEARLVLRIKVDDSHAKRRLSRKFGASLESVDTLLRLAKQLSLNVMGVSFHAGCEGRSPDAYGKAIANARLVFDQAKDMGMEMSLLDIGGGFPGVCDEEEKNLFERMANLIHESLDKYFPDHEFPDLDIIAEPGRYYVKSAFTLTAMIIGKRVDKVSGEKEGTLVNYFLNDGTYGAMSPASFNEEDLIPVPEIEPKELKDRALRVSTVWGQTCDSIDVIQRRIVLPDMQVGEWMTFKNMGAYSLSAGTRFNGFTMPVIKTHASFESIKALIATPKRGIIPEFLMGLDEEAMSSLTRETIVRHVWTSTQVPL